MEKKKVAITGIHNSGKTMFLTSLLWQLEKHDEAKFNPEEDIKIEKFDVLQSSSRRKDAFPFYHYRNRMVYGNQLKYGNQWPQKTTDIHQIRCQFDRSSEDVLFDWMQRSPFLRQSLQLDILDFPGERIADAAMAAYDDFGEWSDHMFEYFGQNSSYNEAESWLQKVLEVKDLEIDTAVWAYRETLVSFMRNYRPLISPSTFFLDGEGDLLKPAQLKNAALERPCGLDADSQFVPLPESVRKANPKLAGKMERYFKRYRKAVVQPLFDHLMESDSLIVLVDIPSLLLAGVQRYRDNRRIILDLIEAVSRKKLNISSSSLKRIAFVATKADLISPNDEKGRLKYLLEKMILEKMNERVKSLLSDVKIGWFECSACWSTSPGKSENTLKGVPLEDNPDKKRKEFLVTPLPDGWPTDWNPEEYRFPDVYPDVPPDVQTPPKHDGLNRVFDFIVSDEEGQS